MKYIHVISCKVDYYIFYMIYIIYVVFDNPYNHEEGSEAYVQDLHSKFA